MNFIFCLGLGLLVSIVGRRFVPGRDFEASLGVFGLGILGAALGNLFARYALRMPQDAYFVFFSSAFMSAWFITSYRTLFRRNPPPFKVQRIVALPRIPAPIVRMRRPFERDVVFLARTRAIPVPSAKPSLKTASRLMLSIEKAG